MTMYDMGAIYVNSIPFYLPAVLLSVLYQNKPDFKLKLSTLFPSDPYITPWIFGIFQVLLLYIASIYELYNIVFYLLPLFLMLGIIISMDKTSKDFHLAAVSVIWIIISLLLFLIPFREYYQSLSLMQLYTTSHIIIYWLNFPVIQIVNVVVFYLICRNKIRIYRYVK